MRLFLILIAAVGIPYVWFSDHLGTLAKERWEALVGSDRGTAPTSLLIGDEGGIGQQMAHRSAIASPQDPIDDLQDVLRFDVSPHWVTQRWSRVSTVHVEKELEGLRVPLVTGIAVDDLAGSLTYYFDQKRQVQRISFHGRTGDERKLVALVQSVFGMRSEPILGAGMYVARWNATPTSVLRVSFAPVVRTQQPHQRLQVAMEINRPNVYFGLSKEFEAMLQVDQHTKRW